MKVYTILIPSAGFASRDLLLHLNRNSGGHYKLVLSDMNPGFSWKGFADSFHVSPPIKSAEYFDFMVNVVKKEGVDAILPGKADDAVFFSENKRAFEKLGVAVVVSEKEAVARAVNKEMSYAIARDGGLSVPDYVSVNTPEGFRNAIDALGHPERQLCIKPSRYPSESGRGFRVLDKKENVHERLFWAQPSELYFVTSEQVIEAMESSEEFPPQLVMEYLPGDEFSVYCLCQNGDAVYVIPNKRLTLHQMSSMEAIVEHNEEVEKYARRICRLFGFDYCVNIQLKYSRDGIPKLVEINPRVAGTIMLPVKAGVDILHFAIQSALGASIPEGLQLHYGTRIKREFLANYYYD